MISDIAYEHLRNLMYAGVISGSDSRADDLKRIYHLTIHWNRINGPWTQITEGIKVFLTLLQRDKSEYKLTLDFSYSVVTKEFTAIPIKDLQEMCEAFPPQINQLIVNIQDLESYSDAELKTLGKNLHYIQKIGVVRNGELCSYPRLNYAIAYMGNQLLEVIKQFQIEDQTRNILTEHLMPPVLSGIILDYFLPDSPSEAMCIFWKNRNEAIKYLEKDMKEDLDEYMKRVTKIPSVPPIKKDNSFKLQCLCALALIGASALLVGIIAISTASGIPLIIVGSASLMVALHGLFNRKETVSVTAENELLLTP